MYTNVARTYMHAWGSAAIWALASSIWSSKTTESRNGLQKKYVRMEAPHAAIFGTARTHAAKDRDETMG